MRTVAPRLGYSIAIKADQALGDANDEHPVDEVVRPVLIDAHSVHTGLRARSLHVEIGREGRGARRWWAEEREASGNERRKPAACYLINTASVRFRTSQRPSQDTSRTQSWFVTRALDDLHFWPPA